MSSLLQAIEQDLRALTASAKKKSVVKEAAERGILRLRLIQEGKGALTPQECARAVLRTDEVLRPFLVACDNTHVSLVVQALTGLQKLLVHTASAGLPAEQVDAVVALLDGLHTTSEETVHFKVLQTLSILVNSMPGTVPQGALHRVMLICVHLFASSNVMVSNTASATMRQIVNLVFERVQKHVEGGGAMTAQAYGGEDPFGGDATASGASSASTGVGRTQRTDSTAAAGDLGSDAAVASMRPAASISSSAPQGARDGGLPATLPPSCHGAYLLFQDCCLFACGDAGKWLTRVVVPVPLALELIEGVLNAQSKLFLHDVHFQFLLKERVCSLMISGLRSNDNFTMMVRLLRVLVVLVKKFTVLLKMECEIYLKICIELLRGEHSLWERVLALEVWKVLCADADILRLIVEHYDEQANFTKIFQNMVDAVGRFVESTFDGDVSSMVIRPPTTAARGILELLTERDAPVIGQRYSVALGVECLLCIVESLSTLVAAAGDGEQAAPVHRACTIMCNSSWPAVLASLSSLLTYSEEENMIQTLLKAYQSFTQTCGQLALPTPRDALLTSLCKFCLPPYGIELAMQSDMPLTAKNVQSIKALFNITHGMGEILDDAWTLVLETLKQLQTLLRATLVHASAGSATSSVGSGGGAVSPVSPASPGAGAGGADFAPPGAGTGHTAELPILLSALERLFETSGSLGDKSLLCVVDALCALSRKEASDKAGLVVSGSTAAVSVAVSPGTPLRSRHHHHHHHHHATSPTTGKGAAGGKGGAFATTANELPFALRNLNEVMLHNIPRVELLLDRAMRHLKWLTTLENQPAMRASGADVLSTFILAVLAYPNAPPAFRGQRAVARAAYATDHDDGQVPALNPDVQRKLLEPVGALCRCTFADTKTSMMNTVFLVLQSFGENLTVGWGVVLDVLQSVAHDADASFVQRGLKCVQLITNDFLTTLPIECVRGCIATVGAYCAQQTDLNISLTAVGLLWSIADFLGKQRTDGTGESDTGVAAAAGGSTMAGESEESELHGLWMALFEQVRHMGGDARPEARNSALRTLFSTINTHGTLLSGRTWALVLKSVLLELLDLVWLQSMHASGEEAVETLGTDSGGNRVMMMVHHSRNTAQKQWDETRVLTLNGVLRVVRTFLPVLNTLPTFDASWEIVLGWERKAMADQSEEVASAAVHALHELMLAHASKPFFVGAMWTQCWDVYSHTLAEAGTQTEFSAKTLNAVIKSCTTLYAKVPSVFDETAVATMIDMLVTHVLPRATPNNRMSLSSPSAAVIALLGTLQPASESSPLWPHVFSPLVRCVCNVKVDGVWLCGADEQQQIESNSEMSPLSSIHLVERALEALAPMFAHVPSALRADAFEKLVVACGRLALARTLLPACETTVWSTAIACMMSVLRSTLTPDSRASMWEAAVQGLRAFLLGRGTEGGEPEDLLRVELQLVRECVVAQLLPQCSLGSAHRRALLNILCDLALLWTSRTKVATECMSVLFDVGDDTIPFVLRACENTLRAHVNGTVSEEHVCFLLGHVARLPAQHVRHLYVVLCETVASPSERVRSALKDVLLSLADVMTGAVEE